MLEWGVRQTPENLAMYTFSVRVERGRGGSFTCRQHRLPHTEPLPTQDAMAHPLSSAEVGPNHSPVLSCQWNQRFAPLINLRTSISQKSFLKRANDIIPITRDQA